MYPWGITQKEIDAFLARIRRGAKRCSTYAAWCDAPIPMNACVMLHAAAPQAINFLIRPETHLERWERPTIGRPSTRFPMTGMGRGSGARYKLLRGPPRRVARDDPEFSRYFTIAPGSALQRLRIG